MLKQLKGQFNTKPTNKEYKEIKIFFNAFIEAFLWTEELDENTLKDFEINCLKILYKDCRNFLIGEFSDYLENTELYNNHHTKRIEIIKNDNFL